MANLFLHPVPIIPPPEPLTAAVVAQVLQSCSRTPAGVIYPQPAEVFAQSFMLLVAASTVENHIAIQSLVGALRGLAEFLDRKVV